MVMASGGPHPPSLTVINVLSLAVSASCPPMKFHEN